MTTLGASISRDLLLPGSLWQLKSSFNGYARLSGNELVTQVARGRSFQVALDQQPNNDKDQISSRIKVRLLEDGYVCWLNTSEFFSKACQRENWEPLLLSKSKIKQRLPSVVKWVEEASKQPNQYLWGGTLGPDFDCSGLVQSAFASEDIWLPRDAYQQERFCSFVSYELDDCLPLQLGDLLFFGTSQRCDHVAIYIGDGRYFHSSGKANGNNGIGSNRLFPSVEDSVSYYYRSRLRCVGRVARCHDGTTLP